MLNPTNIISTKDIEETVSDADMWIECTVFKGNIVLLSFYVDGSEDMAEVTTKQRLAISRWLVKQFKQVKEIYKGFTLVNEPYDEDGFGEYRIKIYNKLGFVERDGYLTLDN
jgi:hypothetical protein